MNKHRTTPSATMHLEACGSEVRKFRHTPQLEQKEWALLRRFAPTVAMSMLLMLLALTNGCGGPDSTPHAQPAGQLSADRHVDAPGKPGIGAAPIPPVDSPAIDNSRTPEERVINSALDSLKLRLAVQAENDPQKRAALEKQLQQVKFARQSIYARE